MKAWLAAGVAAVFLLGACTSDPNSVSAQAQKGDNKGYVSGDGTVERIAVDKRAEPVQLTGTTLDGKAWSATDERGKVVVLNKWGSWCPPCVAEAPALQKSWEAFQAAKRPVQFVGIDFRESAATGAAFVRSRGITYPSLSDPSGVADLSLQGKAACTPTTLVLDQQGRIAGRVCGPVDATTLTGLVDDVLAGAGA